MGGEKRVGRTPSTPGPLHVALMFPARSARAVGDCEGTGEMIGYGARGDGMSAENQEQSADLRSRVQELIDTMINPAVAGHGGFVELVDVQDSRVYLQMGGGCQGCGAADITLKAGIERLLKEEIPEILEVLDTTDHGSGTNPYYASGKA